VKFNLLNLIGQHERDAGNDEKEHGKITFTLFSSDTHLRGRRLRLLRLLRSDDRNPPDDGLVLLVEWTEGHHIILPLEINFILLLSPTLLRCRLGEFNLLDVAIIFGELTFGHDV